MFDCDKNKLQGVYLSAKLYNANITGTWDNNFGTLCGAQIFDRRFVLEEVFLLHSKAVKIVLFLFKVF